MDKTSNSIYNQAYSSLNVLVFIPHEDDEILTCGNLIKLLSDCKATITIVYTTNGDWKYPARIRFEEAIRAASVLGVPSERIIFMGYGDSAPGYASDHIFYSGNTPVKSKAGHIKTYGTSKFRDFSFDYREVHSDYTSNCYLADIIAIIENLRPDLILCSDFDEHPDHKMLSLSFDRAMGLIRREHPDYKPTVWKSFAYALAYNAIADYTHINNPETKKPEIGKTLKYNYDMIGSSFCQWNDRIRIPVVDVGFDPIRKTILGRALLKHRSQYVIRNADRILNSDEIFWERRTDGVGYGANIETSSGEGKYLNDFLLINVRDIDGTVPEFSDYCWRPDEEDNVRTVKFTWTEPQTLEKIVLYGAISQDSSIQTLQITLSDGRVFCVSDIPCNGNPLPVDLGHCEGITFCELKILNTTGHNYGLSECEFYSSAAEDRILMPFIKILIEDNFAYEYVLTESERQLNLGIYSYGTSDNPDQIKVVSGKSWISDGKLIIDPADRDIVLRAKDDSGTVWDEVKLSILRPDEMRKLMKRNCADAQYLKRKRTFFRIHNMLYLLRHEGISAVLKRTVRNGIIHAPEE